MSYSNKGLGPMHHEDPGDDSEMQELLAKFSDQAEDNYVGILRGPCCDNYEWRGVCKHSSCETIDNDQAVMECPRGLHGVQHVKDGGSFTGFAGGRSCWTELECGCIDLDESDDLRAAY